MGLDWSILMIQKKILYKYPVLDTMGSNRETPTILEATTVETAMFGASQEAVERLYSRRKRQYRLRRESRTDIIEESKIRWMQEWLKTKIRIKNAR
jgi:hypothetical protein